MLTFLMILVGVFVIGAWLYWTIVAWARMLGRVRDWLNRNYYEEYAYDDKYEGVS